MTIQCKDWHAWFNLMPPKPDTLHVVGDVVVPNPGVQPVLTMKEPQGINPTILLLDLQLVQQPGIWPQVVSCVQARFDRVLVKPSDYVSVQILHGDEIIVTIKKIDVVH